MPVWHLRTFTVLLNKSFADLHTYNFENLYDKFVKPLVRIQIMGPKICAPSVRSLARSLINQELYVGIWTGCSKVMFRESEN